MTPRPIATAACLLGLLACLPLPIGAQPGPIRHIPLAPPQPAALAEVIVTPLEPDGLRVSAVPAESTLLTRPRFELVLDGNGTAAGSWRPAALDLNYNYIEEWDFLSLGSKTDAALRTVTWTDGVDVDALCRRQRLDAGQQRYVLGRAEPWNAFGDPNLIGVYLSERSINAGELSHWRDVGGGAWLAYLDDFRITRIGRFDADCSVSPIDIALDVAVHSIVNVPTAEAAYLVTSGDDGNLAAPRSLRLVNASGLVWDVALPLDAREASVRALANGDALLQIHADTYTRLVRVSQDGVLRWERSLSSSGETELDIQDIATLGDRLLVAVTLRNFPTMRRLLMLAADGGLESDQPLGASPFVEPIRRFLAENGAFEDRLIVLGTGYPGSSELQRIRADGAVETVYGSDANLDPVARLGDGRIVALRTTFGAPPYVTTLVTLTPSDTSPVELALPPIPAPLKGVSAIRSDGAVLVIMEGQNGQRLHRLEDSGQSIWSLPADPSAIWVTNGARVCALGRTALGSSFGRVVCYAIEDGAIVSDVDVAHLNLHTPALHLRPNGEIRIVDRYSRRHESTPSCTPSVLLVRLSATGQLVEERTLECPPQSGSGLVQFAFAEDGGFAYSVRAEIGSGSGTVVTQPMLRVYASDGSRRFEAALSSEFPTHIDISPDGSVLVADADHPQADQGLLLFDADGTPRWNRSLAPLGARLKQVALIGNEWILVAERFASNSAGGTEILTVTARLDGLGRFVWTNTLVPASVGATIVSGDADGLWLIDTYDGVAFGLDANTGALLGQRALGGEVLSVWSGSAGTLSVLTPDAFTEYGPDVARANSLALDQPAVAGLWYRPEVTGQGIDVSLLQDASGSTLAAGWFTFGPESGRAGLRWYTLAGQIAPGATSAPLTIYRNAGGRFDQGTTAPEAVGTATVRLVDCDALNIQYQLRAQEGLTPRSSTLRLQRLTPRSVPCLLPGDTPPLPSTSPAVAGTWYRPGSSGQGLTLQVLAPEAQVIGGGWFTYDPDGAADEPLAQHWLTWIGTRGDDGEYAVEITRTIHGGFNADATLNSYRVGEGRLRFVDCAHLQLDYVFDDSAFAAEFAGLQGTQALERLGAGGSGGCR